MNFNERKQALLLEAYLQTLRDDPTATPPDGLAPDVAELARKLAANSVQHVDPATRERVWSQAQMRAREGAFTPVAESARGGWLSAPLLLTACLLVVVFFVGVGVYQPSPQDAYASSGDTTPVATPTSTPIDTDLMTSDPCTMTPVPLLMTATPGGEPQPIQPTVTPPPARSNTSATPTRAVTQPPGWEPLVQIHLCPTMIPSTMEMPAPLMTATPLWTHEPTILPPEDLNIAPTAPPTAPPVSR